MWASCFGTTPPKGKALRCSLGHWFDHWRPHLPLQILWGYRNGCTLPKGVQEGTVFVTVTENDASDNSKAMPYLAWTQSHFQCPKVPSYVD